MNSLRRSLVVAMGLVGLMVGVSLRAQSKVADPTFLDALEVSKSNLRAAASLVRQGTTLSSEDAKAVAEKLSSAAHDVDDSQAAWGAQYPGQRDKFTVKNPAAAVALQDQLEKAKTDFAAATAILQKTASEDHGREGKKEKFVAAKTALEHAISKLSDAQALMKTPAQNANGGQQVSQDTSLEDEATATTAAETEKKAKDTLAAEQAQQQHEAPQHPGMNWAIVISGAALLLSLCAIVLAFIPMGPVKELRSDKLALNRELVQTGSRQATLDGEVANLRDDVAALKKKAKTLADTASVATIVSIPEDWDKEDRRKAERRREQRPGVMDSSDGTVRVGSGSRSSERDAEMAEAPIAAPKPKSLNPLADYNTARAMKASDRVAEYARLYPNQMVMACTNPSARNSGPFTELRFKESDFGNFLAINDGKQTLLFPELNYNYSTGRKTLEGVFQYPDVESASFRLVQPGTLERRGDEWALTRQGVFQNG